MNTLLALRHVPFEDLGSFEPLLAEAGYAIRYVDAPTANFAALARQHWALVVVMGGPISVNARDDYPFLAAELDFIERRLKAESPLLGVCLGSQFMAKALGARIYAGEQVEIGWQALEFTAAGRDSPLRHLGGPVFHWHGETFDLPAGAVRLASTAVCENQAFRYGRSALAMQFHPEVTARGLEQWYVGHGGELHAHGIAPGALRQAARQYAAALREQARTFLEEWLAGLAPVSAGLDVNLGAQLDF